MKIKDNPEFWLTLGATLQVIGYVGLAITLIAALTSH